MIEQARTAWLPGRKAAPTGVGASVILGVGVGLADVNSLAALLSFSILGALLWRMSGSSWAAVRLPGVLALAMLAFSIVGVPIAWSLGIADPWPETSQRILPMVLVGVFAGGCWTVGYITASHRITEPECVAFEPVVLARYSILALGVGTIGLGLTVGAMGGASAALESLAVRREAFEGVGPAMALATAPAFGMAAAIELFRRTRRHWHLWLAGANGIAFVGAMFYTGNKSRLLFLALFILAAAFRGKRVRAAWLLFVVLMLVPISTLYHYEVRQRIPLGVAEGEVDTSNVVGFVRTTFGPFADSGLDILRTTDAANRQAPVIAYEPQQILKAPLTAVPRAVWPGKPDGAALEFSKQYFPEYWARGTGIPPSLPAEFIWSFGLLGGLLALFAAGHLFGKLETFIRRRMDALFYWMLWYSLIPMSIIALKAGTDSGFRAWLLFAVGGTIPLIFERVHSSLMRPQATYSLGRSGIRKRSDTVPASKGVS
jgi:hypothetical protein